MECEAARRIKDRKKRVSGKFCVAGGPESVSCNNNSKTKGISMHKFPQNKDIREQWTRFVQRHRPEWKPTETSVLCSAHFLPSCFEDLHLGQTENMSLYNARRWLTRDAVPTIDCARVVNDNDIVLSSRERRMVSIAFKLMICIKIN